MISSKHPIREVYRASIRHALGPSQVETFEDGLLLLDDQGKIVACGFYEELVLRLPKDCTTHDYRGFWIVPGFVDCHTHLPQLDCRNKNGHTLLDWLKIYIYPAEAKFADPKIAEGVALRFFDELLSHGITTASIYSTIHFEATDIAFKIAKDKGLRVIIGQVLMDQNAPVSLLKPATQSLRESEKLIAKWHGVDGKLFYALTPRFALTCSKNLIRDAGKMSQEASCYFQTHMAETKEEVSQAKDLYQFKNYTGFYESNHCLGSRSLFAHCIYLNEAEWRLLGEYKGCVAHCPTSNVFLKSGTMPVLALEKEGIHYGFGTDVGAGPTFSMMEVGDCAHEIHPKGVVTNEKAFYLATLGGAEALALSDQTGNFIEGKWADFAVFEKSDCKGIANEVFIQGNCVWKKGKSV